MILLRKQKQTSTQKIISCILTFVPFEMVQARQTQLEGLGKVETDKSQLEKSIKIIQNECGYIFPYAFDL